MNFTLTNIVSFILMLILNSLFIFGLNKITEYEIDNEGKIIEDSKMFLWKIRFLFIKYLGSWYSRPFILCVICMSSIIGSIFYWCIMPFNFINIFIWIFYCISLAGLNSFLQKYFD